MLLDNPFFNEFIEHFRENENHAKQDFFYFLKFKSVSAEEDYKEDVRSCAEWLKSYIEEMGFKAELWKTEGPPILFASDMRAGKDKPTLLIYHHYDVQPIDPLQEWSHPPFSPIEIDGEIYARGAQDNKGQCFYVLQALKTWIALKGSLPINIKLCIEGEEEIGSPHLSHILSKKQEALKADYLAVVDVGVRNLQQPAVTLGIVTFTLEVTGSKSDLHSGSHGGIVYNPLHALVEMLSSLRNAEGIIQVPHFYDDVEILNEENRSLLSFDFDEKEYFNVFQAEPKGGELLYSPIERASLRPTLEINGISGGYTGKGFKTVIPAKAMAKISCRLVPRQSPDKIALLVKEFLMSKIPRGVKATIHIHEGKGEAIRSSARSMIAQAFAQAYQEVFLKPCSFIYEGGSIPIVQKLAKASGSEVVLVGLGLPDDQIHAPNEHFGWDRIRKGTLIVARAIQLLGLPSFQ